MPFRPVRPMTIGDHMTVSQHKHLDQNYIATPSHSHSQKTIDDMLGVCPVDSVKGGREHIAGNSFIWSDKAVGAVDRIEEEVFFPHEGTEEDLEVLLCDLEDPPQLSHYYKYDCICGTSNEVPKSMLMSAKDASIGKGIECQDHLPKKLRNKFTTTIPCVNCGHRGLAMVECQYPDCWWKMFCRTDTKNVPLYCLCHKENDPLHVKDLLKECVSVIEKDGSKTYYGGQAYLDAVKELDDYDVEYYQFLEENERQLTSAQ